MPLVFEYITLQNFQVSFALLFRQATTMQQFVWQPDPIELLSVLKLVYEGCGNLMQAMDQTSNKPGRLEQMWSLVLGQTSDLSGWLDQKQSLVSSCTAKLTATSQASSLLQFQTMPRLSYCCQALCHRPQTTTIAE